MLLALVGLVLGGHQDTDLLDETLVLLHHLLFLLFDSASLGLFLFDGLDAVVEFGYAITKLTEEVHVLEKHKVSLLLEVFNRIVLVRLKGRELMLAGVDSGEFLAALLILDFDIFFKLVDALDIFVGTNDILQVLQEAGLILVLSLSFHQRDLLDLTLEDEESVMLEVDTLGAEELADFLERGLLTIDTVGGLTLTIDCA